MSADADRDLTKVDAGLTKVDAGAGSPELSMADGVFSGGGIKGLAFAGALAGAEEAGYRNWHALAGTSAGAITAMALAVGYDAAALTNSLDAYDFQRIADYGSPIHLLGAVRDLVFHESLVQGDELTRWIRDVLGKSPLDGVGAETTFGELRAQRGDGELVVIGADIAHSRVVEFPRDVALYQDRHGQPIDPDSFPIHKAVRISAGYPYFFPPVGGLWDRSTKKEGVFVDGGVASAFPLFVFDKPQPRHPTWGFHLHGGFDANEDQPSHRDIGGVTWPKEMLEGILDTAVNALDKFELHGFRSRVIPIPTGAVSTLNFNLSDSEKAYLYESGLKAAQAFFAASPNGENSYGEVPRRRDA
jgi:NTE family protein